MCSSENQLKYNDNECEYDFYGDTRKRSKFNEDQSYSKHSFSFKEKLRINYIKKEKEIKKENNKNKNNEENDSEKIIKNKKRKIKQINEEDENKGNNYEEIIKKPKKKKLPKKDRVRF